MYGEVFGGDFCRKHKGLLILFFLSSFSSKNNYKRLFIEEPQRLLLSLQAVKVESKLNGFGKC